MLFGSSVELYATLLNAQALRKPLETDVGKQPHAYAWRPLYHHLFPFLKFLWLRAYK